MVLLHRTTTDLVQQDQCTSLYDRYIRCRQSNLCAVHDKMKSKSADRLELAARLIAALYAITRNRRNVFVPMGRIAEMAGLTAEQAKRAGETAEAAGFVVVREDGSDAMITEKGRQAAGER